MRWTWSNLIVQMGDNDNNIDGEIPKAKTPSARKPLFISRCLVLC